MSQAPVEEETKLKKEDRSAKKENPAEKLKQKSLVYVADRVIGNGSFGVVYQAHVADTGECVAIKKVFQDKRYKNREYQIMKDLDHPSIVKMREAKKTILNNEVYLNIIMEYVPDTVYRIMKHYSKIKQSVPGILVKLYIYQLARALA